MDVQANASSSFNEWVWRVSLTQAKLSEPMRYVAKAFLRLRIELKCFEKKTYASSLFTEKVWRVSLAHVKGSLINRWV